MTKKNHTRKVNPYQEYSNFQQSLKSITEELRQANNLQIFSQNKMYQEAIRKYVLDHLDQNIEKFKKASDPFVNGASSGRTIINGNQAKILPPNAVRDTCQQIFQNNLDYQACTNMDDKSKSSIPFSQPKSNTYFSNTIPREQRSEYRNHESLHNEATASANIVQHDLNQRKKTRLLCDEVDEESKAMAKEFQQKMLDLNKKLDERLLYEGNVLNTEQKQYKARNILDEYIDYMNSLENRCQDLQ